MGATYTIDGEEVLEVWESYKGSYWVVTDDPDREGSKFGFVSLAGHRQFAEWGHFDSSIIGRKLVWQVPERNWTFTGPDSIDIVKE